MARIYINCQVVASNQKLASVSHPLRSYAKADALPLPRLRWSAWLASSIRPTSR